MGANVLSGTLDGVNEQTVERVARQVIGNDLARVRSAWTITQLSALHMDHRTEGLFRVEGVAEVNDESRPWSTVIKVIDNRDEPNVGSSWVWVESELRVYRERLFTNTGLPFRPARCYALEETEPNRFQIWLEDLCEAPQPPWTASQYEETAYRLGRFNGHYATNPPPFASDLGRNRYLTRFENLTRSGNPPDIRPVRNHPLICSVYSAETIDAMMFLRDRSAELVQAAGSVPVSVAHGDCMARNLFPLDDSVVAIDWSGLSVEPIGAALGVLVGSGLSWGFDEAELVASIEPRMFSNYLDGLHDSGWKGNRSHVRLGFFAQFVIYAGVLLGVVPRYVQGISEGVRTWFEARFGARADEWPDRIGKIAPSLAAYATEVESLLLSLS